MTADIFFGFLACGGYAVGMALILTAIIGISTKV